jgi:hypothetical protein
MSDKLSSIQQALEESHEHSSRPGKWSTVSDVRNFEEDTNITSLRRLVKQGAASEKVKGGMPLKLFKPTRAGSGGGEVTYGKKDHEDGRKGNDGRKGRGNRKGKGGRKDKGDRKGKRTSKPRGNKTGKTDKKPKDYKKPEPGDTVKKTMETGIATMLVGGLGSSISGQMAGPAVRISKVAMM